MSTLVDCFVDQTRPQALLLQVLAQARRGRAVFTWRKPKRLLTGKAIQKRERFDQHVVSEFRAKLRVAEDLIGKLGYSLREMQDVPSAEVSTAPVASVSASISQLFSRK
ncbi:MAG: hypothetical protein AAB250_07170 [Bdellovibrionota bacterium]